ncbi:hypothetical protein [Streptomyces virginiae]|uniref:hypothetical protein n=1 Tax=Streptomyces virginiae TaxID=1961 RepID=UPI0022589D0D|nr:hypothetical protein [Streptomyces virginiae]MCX4962794.1 hypothetical protein [Streptomyces virginiae]
MLTSGPDALKILARSTAVLVSVLTLASCTSGGSEAEAANPCGISSSSAEEALVRDVLGAEDFATKDYRTTSRLVDMMKRALPAIRPEKRVFYTNACRYSTDDKHGDVSATFLAGWSIRTSVVPSPPDDASYLLNGARGEAIGSRSSLLVQCDMPGELAAKSRDVWFTADISFSPSPPDVDQTTKDRRMTLTYLMARRVTDALGCENKPLEKPPVVKPLPTP